MIAQLPIQCILADDEPLARRILVEYVRRHEWLECIVVCTNGRELLSALAHYSPDLLLIDVQMPYFSGIEALRTALPKSKVVFTTAFTEYAFEGYELGVSDYLRKPFSYERFRQAVGRAFPDMVEPDLSGSQTDTPRRYIFLKVNRSIQRVAVVDIQYVQAMGNYLKVATEKSILVTYLRMSDIEELLPGKDFVRVHRSWIVAVHRVTGIHRQSIFIGSVEIPISCKVQCIVEDNQVRILPNDC
jgi:two-component system, LytTR family, response regulator